MPPPPEGGWDCTRCKAWAAGIPPTENHTRESGCYLCPSEAAAEDGVQAEPQEPAVTSEALPEESDKERDEPVSSPQEPEEKPNQEWTSRKAAISKVRMKTGKLTDPEAWYDAAGDSEKFQRNLKTMMDSCNRFLDLSVIDTHPMSEYLFGD